MDWDAVSGISGVLSVLIALVSIMMNAKEDQLKDHADWPKSQIPPPPVPPSSMRPRMPSPPPPPPPLPSLPKKENHYAYQAYALNLVLLIAFFVSVSTWYFVFSSVVADFEAYREVFHVFLLFAIVGGVGFAWIMDSKFNMSLAPPQARFPLALLSGMIGSSIFILIVIFFCVVLSFFAALLEETKGNGSRRF